MSEPKYNLGKPEECVSLSEVTTSSKERAKVEANRNTSKEDARVDANNAQRNADQIAHWEKQAQGAAQERKSAAVNELSKAYLSELIGENASNNINELKMISDKTGHIMISVLSVEDRREYAERSRTYFQSDNFFGENDELDDMENKIFEALKNDKDIQSALKVIFTSEQERDYFIKKAVRAERSSVYEAYLNKL